VFHAIDAVSARFSRAQPSATATVRAAIPQPLRAPVFIVLPSHRPVPGRNVIVDHPFRAWPCQGMIG
jgi:hypothetical protein